MIAGLAVGDVMADGPRACALTRHQLQPPARPAGSSSVAEVFEVRDGKIASFRHLL
jgi:hypothetical protein